MIQIIEPKLKVNFHQSINDNRHIIVKFTQALKISQDAALQRKKLSKINKVKN